MWQIGRLGGTKKESGVERRTCLPAQIRSLQLCSKNLVKYVWSRHSPNRTDLLHTRDTRRRSDTGDDTLLWKNISPFTHTHSHMHARARTHTYTQTGHCFHNSPADQMPVTFPSHRSSRKNGVRPDGLACQTFAAYLKHRPPSVQYSGREMTLPKLKFQNKNPQFGPSWRKRLPSPNNQNKKTPKHVTINKTAMTTFVVEKGKPRRETERERDNKMKHLFCFSLLNKGLSWNRIYRLWLRINRPAAAAPVS